MTTSLQPADTGRIRSRCRHTVDHFIKKGRPLYRHVSVLYGQREGLCRGRSNIPEPCSGLFTREGRAPGCARSPYMFEPRLCSCSAVSEYENYARLEPHWRFYCYAENTGRMSPSLGKDMTTDRQCKVQNKGDVRPEPSGKVTHRKELRILPVHAKGQIFLDYYIRKDRIWCYTSSSPKG